MEGAIGERAPWPQGFIPGERLAMSGDIFVDTTGRCFWQLVVRSPGCCTQATKHKRGAHDRELPVPNTSE